MKCSDKEWQHCNKEKMGCNGCAYNDEIVVGEYVRSLVNGRISKVLEVSDLFEELNVKYYKTGKLTGFCSTENYNVKHSFNIIDLIEEGDYVNGYKVDDIRENKIIIGDTTQVIEQIIENDDIKSIITKEQIKQIEFRIKE